MTDTPDFVAVGGCLCGAVRFGLREKLPPVGFCHCSKCRRVSGTGSSAIVNVRKDRFAWISGQDRLKRFALDSGWSSTFCADCGSPMPQPTTDGTRMFVPAGALDGDPPLAISGHIFVGSKPGWALICDEAPQFEEGAG